MDNRHRGCTFALSVSAMSGLDFLCLYLSAAHDGIYVCTDTV